MTRARAHSSRLHPASMKSYRALQVVCVLLSCSEHRMQGFTKDTCEGDCQYISWFSQRLGWRKVSILLHGHKVSDSVVSDMSQSSLRCLVYDLNTTDTHHTLLEIHDMMFPEVNMVVVMKQVHLLQLMKTVSSFDDMTKGQTDFKHHSKWLLVADDLKSTDLQGYIRLENVVLILPQSKHPLDSVLTLRHHPGGSVFAPVEPCVARDYVSCMFPSTVYGYNNRRLRVVTLESNRFISKYVFNGTTRYEGYAIEILDILTQTLNLSITEPRDGVWGLPVNGTYSGMVGELYRREVDLAASDLIVNEDRARFMDYIYPPLRAEYHDVLYMRHEPPANTSLFLLVRPLQPLVYLVLLLATCVIPCLIAMLDSHPVHHTGETDTTLIRGYLMNFRLNVYSYSWDVLHSLSRQGFSKNPRTLSAKLLVTSWWLLLVVLTSVYCCNLVAALSAHVDSRLFSSLEELLDSDYSVGMGGNSISNSVLEASSNTSIQGRLWAKITENDPGFLMSDVSNHIRRVKQEKYALVMFKSTVDLHLAEDCQLKPLGAQVLWIHLAFGIQKNSPLKDDIQRIMSYLSQSGILEKLWQKWRLTRGDHQCVRERSMAGITLEQISGGFILCGAGLLLSGIVLCLEKLVKSIYP